MRKHFLPGIHSLEIPCWKWTFIVIPGFLLKSQMKRIIWYHQLFNLGIRMLLNVIYVLHLQFYSIFKITNILCSSWAALTIMTNIQIRTVFLVCTPTSTAWYIKIQLFSSLDAINHYWASADFIVQNFTMRAHLMFVLVMHKAR